MPLGQFSDQTPEGSGAGGGGALQGAAHVWTHAHTHRRTYQVADVGGAGALLGDAHAEAGQAAVGVAGAQEEVVGPAVTACAAFHLGLGGRTGG